MTLKLFLSYSSMNGGGWGWNCFRSIGGRVSILFKLNSMSMKVSLLILPHPSGRNSEAKGNEAFQFPPFPRYRTPIFFSPKQNNGRKQWKDGGGGVSS